MLFMNCVVVCGCDVSYHVICFDTNTSIINLLFIFNLVGNKRSIEINIFINRSFVITVTKSKNKCYLRTFV